MGIPGTRVPPEFAGFELTEHRDFQGVFIDSRESDREQLDQLRAGLDLSPSPTFFLSLQDFRFLFANRAGTEFLQTSEDALRALSLHEFVPERNEPELEWLRKAFQAGEQSEGALVVSAGDGIGLSRMSLKLVGRVVVVVDQTKPRGNSDNTSSLADCDPLTGLINRRRLEDRIQQAIDRENRNWGILFLDLNDYKRVNDLYGHVAGDRVLVEFAKKLVASSRPTDLVARYGGDEFVVFVDRISSHQDLQLMADRIAAEVSVEVTSSDPRIVVTASVGCAWASDELTSIDEIITLADRDMYRAKRRAPR